MVLKMKTFTHNDEDYVVNFVPAIVGERGVRYPQIQAIFIECWKVSDPKTIYDKKDAIKLDLPIYEWEQELEESTIWVQGAMDDLGV